MFDLPKYPLKKSRPSIGVLCSGGDAPGMNAAVRAVVRTAIFHGSRVFGIARGYAGIFDREIFEMKESSVANIIQRGGTIIKTSRCPEFMKKSGRRHAADILRDLDITSLVVIGGDGSFRGAMAFEKETGIRTLGVPGTIDNDIFGSEWTIGFDTAMNTGIQAIDKIRDTASSHDRLFLIEVMGHSTGWIAANVGLGGGAETILVPETKFTSQNIVEQLRRGERRGKSSSIVVVAEGARPSERVNELASTLEQFGLSPKVCVLGHIQRGGIPSAVDRILASTLGVASIELLLSGKSNGMVGVNQNKVTFVPFAKIGQKRRPLDGRTLEMCSILSI